MNKKGIVISPPFEPILTGGIRCGGDPDPLELRKYILYWDQIDYPTNNLIHVSSHDIDYLESTGVLKRTRVIFQGEVNTGRGEFLIAAQEAALAENQKKNQVFGLLLNYHKNHFTHRASLQQVSNLSYMMFYPYQR